MTETQERRLSAAQLAELLKLFEGADTVELKLTVPDVERRATIAALEMDPLDAQIRQVVFFDTPALDLNQRGVVVRARRLQGEGDDSVVKLRPVVPQDLPVDLRKEPGFGVEVDAMPGGFVCSASFKGELGTTRVKDTLAGHQPIHHLFSKSSGRSTLTTRRMASTSMT